MAKVYDNILELSGSTPLIRQNGVADKNKVYAELIV